MDLEFKNYHLESQQKQNIIWKAQVLNFPIGF